MRAIDRPSLVRAVYGPSVRPSGGLIPTGVSGHDDDACRDRCRYDPARARALVGEVAHGGAVPQVALDYEEDAGGVGGVAARIVQSSLQLVGVPVLVRPHPAGSYEGVMAGGQVELFSLGWVAAYPSADAVLIDRPVGSARSRKRPTAGQDLAGTDQDLRPGWRASSTCRGVVSGAPAARKAEFR